MDDLFLLLSYIGLFCAALAIGGGLEILWNYWRK